MSKVVLFDFHLEFSKEVWFMFKISKDFEIPLASFPCSMYLGCSQRRAGFANVRNTT